MVLPEAILQIFAVQSHLTVRRARSAESQRI